ncbi:hypothetical protein MNBD_GAMMA07-137 [hydrothermal vent metagenome]|uniref:Peptidase S8/S53 domain-containing protein n=1 Tax=hydrothermal vent metagenome TaxID=652676 RepID=A0A3B0WXC6_9ZZZZ
MLSILITACSDGNKSPPPVTRFSIGGTVTGIKTSINTIINDIPYIINQNASFTFPINLENGAQYTASISKQPSGLLCNIENATGAIKKADITDVNITCVRNSFSISGIISATEHMVVDSDINDPNAVANISNNVTSSAQLINNLASVHGFVSADPTGRSGDRFQFKSDDSDYYQVNLLAGQVIDLQTMDISNNSIFKGDLSLILLDSHSKIMAQATQGEEFQQITVPTNGLYFILVSASNGATKYRLKLNSTNVLHTPTGQSAHFIANEIIIKFKKNVPNRVLSKHHAHLTLSHHDKSRATLAHTTSHDISQKIFNDVSVPEYLSELAATNNETYEKILTLREIKRLNKLDHIEYAEPNYWHQAQRIPNDQHYHFQWHYPLINLPEAWDITTGEPNNGQIIVAVIDTGIYINHVDFVGKLVDGYDFISSTFNANDGDGIDNDPDDPGDDTSGNSSWHGTHVAGIIAANSNNSVGVSGISWGAKIMPIRAIGTLGASSFDIMESLRFAAGLSNASNTVPAQIADVINMSLGGFGFSQSMQNLINQVNDAGIIIIAASGNDNSSELFYPASYDGVISVSATDIENNKASYSNFGSKIDVAAPGGQISNDINQDGQGDGVLSTLVSGEIEEDEDNRASSYAFFQGTSMASPHVAGVVALMRAVYPELTPAEFKNALISGALTNDAGEVGRDNIFGYGIINALKAVKEAQRIENGGTPPEPPALIISTPASLIMGTQNNATLTLNNESSTEASVTNISIDSTWLNVTEKTVDDITKLGIYDITIDRNNLGDANYDSTITFNLSTGNVLTINVSMVVGNISNIGDIGNAYILLLKTKNNALADIIFPVDVGNGNYTYSFNNVPKGSYNIAGGSDIDNDLLLCQLGENCGGYPTFNTLEDIIISNEDLIDIDFTLNILSKINITNSVQGFDISQFLLPDKN